MRRAVGSAVAECVMFGERVTQVERAMSGKCVAPAATAVRAERAVTAV